MTATPTQKVIAGLMLGLLTLGQLFGGTVAVEVRHAHPGTGAGHSHGEFDLWGYIHCDHGHGHGHGNDLGHEGDSEQSPTEDEGGRDREPLHSHFVKVCLECLAICAAEFAPSAGDLRYRSYFPMRGDRCPDDPFYEVMKPPQLA